MLLYSHVYVLFAYFVYARRPYMYNLQTTFVDSTVDGDESRNSCGEVVIIVDPFFSSDPGGCVELLPCVGNVFIVSAVLKLGRPLIGTKNPRAP